VKDAAPLSIKRQFEIVVKTGRKIAPRKKILLFI
jgi:hypothetical protein